MTRRRLLALLASAPAAAVAAFRAEQFQIAFKWLHALVPLAQDGDSAQLHLVAYRTSSFMVFSDEKWVECAPAEETLALPEEADRG